MHFQENEVVGGGSGSFQGINYFTCPDKHGLFLPGSRLKRDNRFTELETTVSDAPTIPQEEVTSVPSPPGSTPDAVLSDFMSKLQIPGNDDTKSRCYILAYVTYTYIYMYTYMYGTLCTSPNLVGNFGTNFCGL